MQINRTTGFGSALKVVFFCLARNPKVATWFIALSTLLVFLFPFEVGAKTKFLGFKQGESENVPDDWELITYFNRAENTMSLVKEGKRTVLSVQSLGSASALLKRLNIDVQAFPTLVWAWKVNRVVGMAVETQKDRNDSAARVRVVFGKPPPKPPKTPPPVEQLFDAFGLRPTGREPRGFKIDYIWGNRVPRGKVFDFPGSKNHKVIVVESGKSKTNRWVWEKRDLRKDYLISFGGTPPTLIGIVILTDTDHTNEGVKAYYSSVVLMSE